MPADAVLLIGCGSVGRAAARLLGGERAFDRVIVADRNRAKAAAAAEVCGPKATSACFDWSDEETLIKALSGVLVVLNTAGPFTTDVLPLMRTVVEAGAFYADVNDDPDSLQMVFESGYLRSLAEYRAVGVLPGLGASPGQTNVLAHYLGQRLDRVEEVRLYYVDDLRSRAPAVWRRRLAAFGGPALVWRKGRWSHVAPMAETEDAAFPEPWGTVRCHTVGLGPISLPDSLPSLAHASTHCGFWHPEMDVMMGHLVKYGLAGQEKVTTSAGALSPAEFAAALFSGPAAGPLFEFGPGPGRLPRQVQVRGTLRGRPCRFTMTYSFPVGETAEDAASALVVGARMLAGRELPAPGLFPPERLDPAPFLWEMERRGVNIQLRKESE